MEHKEWVDKLRWLSPEQIVQVHFGLQEDIKKFYKLREEGDNLARAEHLCEQMIALSELASRLYVALMTKGLKNTNR